MRLTDWVAIAAFAISLTTLLSNLTLLWLKWPRIVVEVAVARRVTALGDGQTAEANAELEGDMFVLAIINTGAEPVTIKNMGFTGSGPAKIHRFEHLDAWPMMPRDELPKYRGVVDQAVLPARIEGHGCRVYEYGEWVLQQLPSNVAYHGFAQRYKSVRWWPNQTKVRETRSRETVFRHPG